MNILDRIKNFLKKTEGEVEQSQAVNTNINLPNSHILPRADGSTLEIAPELDKMGNPTYEQVYNRRTKAIQAIPKFRVSSSNELMMQGVLSKVILMDIDPQLLNNPQYADFIANEMLSAKRMEKVIEEYGNYAGTIRTDSNGRLMKMKDEGIISSLKATNLENAKRIEEDRKVAHKLEADAIRANSANTRTSRAENLSGQEFYR